MPARADAHIHLFHPGYADVLPEACRRVQPDEVTLYEALAKAHDIQQALVVGYEGHERFRGNNAYLARILRDRSWVNAVAYVEPAAITTSLLQQLQRDGFVGISLYLFSAESIDALSALPAEVWNWLEAQAWLLSVNSRAPYWKGWRQILERHPRLNLLISHLGLPPRMALPPSKDEAKQSLAEVLSLGEYPAVHVKLSGFYALSDPSYAYPHRAAWPYVEALAEGFGTQRLVWASDFSPSLEHVSFPQTLFLLEEMALFSDADRAGIEGGNLLTLLNGVKRNG